ncbi:serine/threonine-protein kinase [Nannocystis sp.]|uniref:serine/threonine-protein kinase n=1 Tax=Nannocystis sp. TaxID=1962667 RepID=UPI00344B3779
MLGVVIDARYRVLRQLGHGGMGTVYEVEHVKLGQGRALKFMREELRSRPGAARRFMQEARILSTLSHQHVVSVLDMGEYEGRAYYVMELLAGEDLRIRARREGPFTWARARAIALQICEALVAVHAKGIVHRDLKPSNCFCMQLPRDADFIKLLDFGVAWARLPKGDSTPLSRSGEVFGTVTYMAPEQMDGVSAPSVDIYALGVMMYELLTGKLPFVGTDYAVIAKVLKTLPPSPREHRPDIAPEVEAIVLRALAKDPAARLATMQEFAAAIAAIPAESGRLRRRCLSRHRTAPLRRRAHPRHLRRRAHPSYLRRRAHPSFLRLRLRAHPSQLRLRAHPSQLRLRAHPSHLRLRAPPSHLRLRAPVTPPVESPRHTSG